MYTALMSRLHLHKDHSRMLAGAQIHWFSIFNSFMMVIFLTGLVSMILLRTLRADYARYTAVRPQRLNESVRA